MPTDVTFCIDLPTDIFPRGVSHPQHSQCRDDPDQPLLIFVSLARARIAEEACIFLIVVLAVLAIVAPIYTILARIRLHGCTISSRALVAKILHPTLSAVALISSIGFLFPTTLATPSRYFSLGLPRPLFPSITPIIAMLSLPHLLITCPKKFICLCLTVFIITCYHLFLTLWYMNFKISVTSSY